MKKRPDGRYVRSVTINGKRKMFYSSEPTEKKAERDIMRQMVAFEAKQEEEAKGKTFEEVADEWEEQHYKTIQYQTAERYKSLVARLVDAFKDVHIRDITAKDIDNFLERMVYNQFSTKTIRDQASISRMIFRYAIVNGYISSNPAEYIKPPKGKPKQERQPLTYEEMIRVENGILHDFGFLAFFLLYTGLRKGEALALTYGDIDMKNNKIKINKSLEHIGNRPNVKTPKTESGNRIVPLPEIIKNMLPKNKKNSDIVFSQNGTYMRKSYFRKHWIKYCKDTGLNATPHQFRHTYATFLFECGITEKDAQVILGHSDIVLTHNIYTHVREDRISQTCNILNENIKSFNR